MPGFQPVSSAGSDRGRVADLGNELAAVKRALEALEGRLEVTEHRVQKALEEARSARAEANLQARPSEVPDGNDGEPGEGDDSEEVQNDRTKEDPGTD